MAGSRILSHLLCKNSFYESVIFSTFKIDIEPFDLLNLTMKPADSILFRLFFSEAVSCFRGHIRGNVMPFMR